MKPNKTIQQYIIDNQKIKRAQFIRFIKEDNIDYYNEIRQYSKYWGLDTTSDRNMFYHYTSEMTSNPTCKNCSKPINTKKFNINGKIGYQEYCCRTCAASHTENVKNRAKTRKSKKISVKDKLKKLKDDIIENGKPFSGNISNILPLLKKLTKHSGKQQNCNIILLTKYPTIYKYLFDKYPKISNDMERIYLYVFGMDEPPKCEYCDNYCQYINFSKGYKTICGDSKCIQQVKNKNKVEKLELFSDHPIFELSNLKDMLNDILTKKHVRNLYGSIISEHVEIVNSIVHYSTHLKDTSKFSQRIYDILNDISTIKTCDCCDTPLRFISINVGYGNCQKCASTSIPEKELQLFLEKYDIKYISNNWDILDTKEIDIFLPEYNIGIEHNGIYWHSEKNNFPKYRHLEKTKEGISKNIDILQIFGSEWYNNRKIVKDIILKKCNKIENIIYPSDCIIDKICDTTANDFLHENSLEGRSLVANITYGIYFKNEIVGVISSHIDGDTLIIDRMCEKLNHTIKNFEHFLISINEKENIKISVFKVDRRWYNDIEKYTNKNIRFIGFSDPICYEIVNEKSQFIKRCDINKDCNKIWDCGYMIFECNV